MIYKTEDSGESEIDMRLYLGEWGAREMALATPDPRTKARPRSLPEPEGAPAVTIAWVGPLSHARNAVQSITTPAGG